MGFAWRVRKIENNYKLAHIVPELCLYFAFLHRLHRLLWIHYPEIWNEAAGWDWVSVIESSWTTITRIYADRSINICPEPLPCPFDWTYYPNTYRTIIELCVSFDSKHATFKFYVSFAFVDGLVREYQESTKKMILMWFLTVVYANIAHHQTFHFTYHIWFGWTRRNRIHCDDNQKRNSRRQLYKFRCDDKRYISLISTHQQIGW